MSIDLKLPVTYVSPATNKFLDAGAQGGITPDGQYALSMALINQHKDRKTEVLLNNKAQEANQIAAYLEQQNIDQKFSESLLNYAGKTGVMDKAGLAAQAGVLHDPNIQGAFEESLLAEKLSSAAKNQAQANKANRYVPGSNVKIKQRLIFPDGTSGDVTGTLEEIRQMKEMYGATSPQDITAINPQADPGNSSAQANASAQNYDAAKEAFMAKRKAELRQSMAGDSVNE